MSSQVDGILDALVTKVDDNKSVVQTVTRVIESLDVLERQARQDSSIFPKAVIYVGLSEIPQEGQSRGSNAIGSTVSYRLPISIDLIIKPDTDLQSEREAVIKEVRDIIEVPGATITANNYRIVLPFLSVERGVNYDPANPRAIQLAFGTLNFAIDYDFTMGSS